MPYDIKSTIHLVNHSLKYNKNRNQHIIIINDFNIRTQKMTTYTKYNECTA